LRRVVTGIGLSLALLFAACGGGETPNTPARVASVSAGDDYTFALKTDGTAWGWGHNFFGKLGDNTTTNRLSPVQVVGPGGTGFLTCVASVSNGGSTDGLDYTVALMTDGTVWAWGYNNFGQHGNGTTATN